MVIRLRGTLTIYNLSYKIIVIELHLHRIRLDSKTQSNQRQIEHESPYI